MQPVDVDQARRVQVTITRLPTSLSIVSIPRSRLDALSHPVLRTLLQPNPAFLSITCNTIELSLFAEHEFLSAFDAIARTDQALTGSTDSNGTSALLEPVEISHERWCVLQIDSHSDKLDDAGSRVSELSAPLAAAGISILYQSSYMSDFIFVKERRLAEVMSLFAAAGFALYAADPNLLTASLEPASPSALTRLRSGSAPLPSTSSSSSSKPSSRQDANGKLRASSASKCPEQSMSNPLPTPSSSKQKQKPPVIPDVCILAPDLVCVGLVDDAADQWALKIVKLIAFPDLIPLPTVTSPSSACSSRTQTFPVVEEEEGDDGYFSHSPSPTLDEPDLDTPQPQVKIRPEEEGNLKEAPVPRSTAMEVPCRPDALPNPITWRDPDLPPVSEDPLNVDVGRLDLPQDSRLLVEHKIPFFSFIRTPEGSSLTAGTSALAALFPRAERHMVICGGELDAADREAEATLFSVPSSYVAENGYSDDDDVSDYDSAEELDEDNADTDGHPLLSALQVDLRSAGLDIHGLVHRFSRALARGGVNHMYASTLRSANLLVPTGRGGRGARRASRLLHGC
ncbi:hypothetical protein GGX14DRAFT_413017 [Mycena pura]|uniref:CASTOR ACT domain-containing protein n=1 Tax=Mycena pura TaxID=153505 RepID=A0AAD7E538_9AGAR|nr:hypothetical protein GGX14DRAFT_413017 [Mycena pura]